MAVAKIVTHASATAAMSSGLRCAGYAATTNDSTARPIGPMTSNPCQRMPQGRGNRFGCFQAWPMRVWLSGRSKAALPAIAFTAHAEDTARPAFLGGGVLTHFYIGRLRRRHSMATVAAFTASSAARSGWAIGPASSVTWSRKPTSARGLISSETHAAPRSP